VNAAVDVGILGGVESGDCVNDHLGLLTGGCIVEVDQRLPADSLPKDGEVGTDPIDVERSSTA
jgi:hypothetical protein